MRSPKQIAASRANGARSRGPRTEAGKQRAASGNHFFHGAYSKHLRFLPWESRAEFHQRHESYKRDLQPADPVEHDLVYEIAFAFFRWQNLTRIDIRAFGSTLDPRKLMNHFYARMNAPNARRFLSIWKAADAWNNRAFRAYESLLQYRRGVVPISRLEPGNLFRANLANLHPSTVCAESEGRTKGVAPNAKTLQNPSPGRVPASQTAECHNESE